MRVTQGTFSFLPDLTDDEIRAQVQYCLDHDWPISIEWTDDPHPRNYYWEMWGNPMFDVKDAAAVSRAFTGIDLQLWVYIGRADKKPTDVAPLISALKAGGYDLSRLLISIGLWAGEADADPPGRITPSQLATAVSGAEGAGATSVNVTPYSLMTDAHWEALASVWG